MDYFADDSELTDEDLHEQLVSLKEELNNPHLTPKQKFLIRASILGTVQEIERRTEHKEEK